MPYLLKGKMAVYGVTAKEIGELLGIHPKSASNKVNGITSFSIEEAEKIRNKYFPGETLEHLFKRVE